ncbi:hypothetical protein [Nitrososphaera sp.]|uniref:hypothetical protein n=1 Tax=Nitrososphaera sp. TaxID=1971748 RepID=UPI0018491D2E|nr:hypothetical protein [Nitrososphaera sp.]NWG37900.1 hypothetical protein [Nitrososphaera sp.]
MPIYPVAEMPELQNPNILNPFVLMDPSVAPAVALVVMAVSVSASFLIARYFFKSYSFSGFGYLLGFPTGFAFLGLSYFFQFAGWAYAGDALLHPAFFWMQIILQAEGITLIALSYHFKNSIAREDAAVTRYRPRHMLVAVLPMLMVAVSFIIPSSAFVSSPYFNYPRLADLSFVMTVFNIAVLGYIFKSAIISLVKSANAKLLYAPAAFALLSLEQYSLVLTYFDNSSVAFAGSLVVRVAGLALLVYAMRHAIRMAQARRRDLEIEA